jgi:hypothetical protein
MFSLVFASYFPQMVTLCWDPTDSVIISGAYSLLGAVTGRAKVITDFEDLAQNKISIEPEDIIFTAKTANYW